MTQTAYTVRNGDGSLKHRVDEYLETLSAYQNVQFGMKHAKDPEWEDTLGHKQDIEQAEKILKNSMSRVVGMIDQSEIKQALSLGLMNEAQAWELSSAKEQVKAEQLTDKKQKSRSRRK